MKTIGIIGGFGPEATAQFYLRVVEDIRIRALHKNPRIIVRHVFVPQKLEHDALVLGKNLDAFIPSLISAAKDLERAGADIIVLPCNTLHIHERNIRESVHVPFISIITSTINHLIRHNITHVGLLGSRVTIKENLFKKHEPNITFTNVPPALQKKIDLGLQRFVSLHNSQDLTDTLKQSFIFFKQRDIQHILIACTDFHALCPEITPPYIHDTLDILAQATVDML